MCVQCGTVQNGGGQWRERGRRVSKKRGKVQFYKIYSTYAQILLQLDESVKVTGSPRKRGKKDE